MDSKERLRKLDEIPLDRRKEILNKSMEIYLSHPYQTRAQKVREYLKSVGYPLPEDEENPIQNPAQ
ncbi:hypothetical protein [Pseudacidobacterium ailaaui]|uniref:hypothetical protein n=1 Tax=Pseudacidobacterium ailaaui TaxID=1382359 RepID=UPI00047932D9|nr:hypothetical protein [Pseudacidobacterium ailaaui]